MAADKTVGTLNHLIAVCRDAEEFYGYAADKVSGSQLQPLLRDTAACIARSARRCGRM